MVTAVQPRTRDRISIVDDDPSVGRALARMFRTAGYTVTAFGSAEAFLEARGPGSTDCLILDVHLPGLSGLDLQSKLQELESRIPIIFITAFNSEQARAAALRAGARAFLRKPLDTEHLLELLREVLADA